MELSTSPGVAANGAGLFVWGLPPLNPLSGSCGMPTPRNSIRLSNYQERWRSALAPPRCDKADPCNPICDRPAYRRSLFHCCPSCPLAVRVIRNGEYRTLPAGMALTRFQLGYHARNSSGVGRRSCASRKSSIARAISAWSSSSSSVMSPPPRGLPYAPRSSRRFLVRPNRVIEDRAARA